MGRWIGRSLMGIAVVHTAIAAVGFARSWRAMLQDGLLDAVGGDAARTAAAWFALFGLLLLALGVAVDALERDRIHPPRALGVVLAVLVACGVLLMPVSGFWLALPAVVALLRAARRGVP